MEVHRASPGPRRRQEVSTITFGPDSGSAVKGLTEAARASAVALITFGATSAEQVLAGKKTVTFRKWPTAKVKAGETHDAARMGYPPKKFARVKVTDVTRIRLKDINDPLARRDGAGSAEEVRAYWSKQGFKADDELWLIEFQLV